MLNQIKNIAYWCDVKLNNKLGQRGAEMVEYAIVLACIAAVGVAFYATSAGGGGTDGLSATLDKLWDKVFTEGKVTNPKTPVNKP